MLQSNVINATLMEQETIPTMLCDCRVDYNAVVSQTVAVLTITLVITSAINNITVI